MNRKNSLQVDRRGLEIHRYVGGNQDDTIETDEVEQAAIASSSIWLNISTNNDMEDDN